MVFTDKQNGLCSYEHLLNEKTTPAEFLCISNVLNRICISGSAGVDGYGYGCLCDHISTVWALEGWLDVAFCALKVATLVMILWISPENNFFQEKSSLTFWPRCKD